jgi:cellulose synthase operon protein C
MTTPLVVATVSRSRLAAGLATALALAGAASLRADVLDDARQQIQSGDLRSAMIALKGRLQQDPADAHARALLAQVYLALRNGAAAEEELRRGGAGGALGEDELTVELAEALLVQGKLHRIVEDNAVETLADPAARARLHAIRGEAYLDLSDPEQAGLEFGKALEIDPGLVRAVLGQGRLAMSQGARARARELVAQALTLDPKDKKAWQAMGELELNAGRFAEADSALGKAIEQGGVIWMPLYERALARIELGDLAGAAADLKAAEQQFPSFSGLAYARGTLYLKQGKPEQAFAELSLFLKSMPSQPQAIYLAGAALYQLKRYHEAEEYLVRAHAGAPGSVPYATLLATDRLALGNAKGAEEVLRPLMQDEKAPAEVLRPMVQALSAQGRTEEARAALRRLAAAAPDDPATRMMVAESLLEEGKTADAERALRALANAPGQAESVRLALIRLLLGKPDAKAALVEAQALVAATPKSPRAYNALALARLLGNDEAGARQALQRALELEPGFPEAARNLAKLELQADRPDAARALYEQILAAQPGYADALLWLAQLDVAAGNKAAAVERLRAAAAADPGNVGLRLNLAQGYRSLGQTQEASRLLLDAPAAVADDPRLLKLRAEMDLESSQPYNAITTLETLIAKQPASADGHHMLALAYAATKNVGAMQEQLLTGYKIDSKSPLAVQTLDRVYAALPDAASKRDLLIRLKGLGGNATVLALLDARLNMDEGQFKKGLEQLAALQKSAPGDRGVLLLLLDAQVKGGDLFAATQTANAWIKQEPQDFQVRRMLAQIYARRGRTDQAVETYRALVKDQPDDPAAHNNLASLLLDKDPAGALAHARSASQAAPKDPAIADTLGQALLAAGDPTGAVAALAQAYGALPGEPSVALHYARALAAAGDPAKARAVLLPMMDKSFPEKPQAQALLKTLMEQ